MSEPKTLHTPTRIVTALRDTGLSAGQTVLMHSAMGQIGGWVMGGAETVLHALLEVLGDAGTLMVPTHTADNSDPRKWQNPPIPKAWWQTVRDEMPAYDPVTSITRKMGILAEQFRRWEGVTRSSHPIGSFAARGKHADTLTAIHKLDSMFGEDTPLSTLYDLDGDVLLLGVGYGNCTALHLAEARADYPDKAIEAEGCAMHVNGQRQWVTFDMIAWNDDDFPQIGAAYEQAYPDAVTIAQVGNATTRLFKVRPLVDFATEWMAQHRPQSLHLADE